MLLPDALEAIGSRLRGIEDRVSLLRGAGKLSKQTLIDYYGLKRFEQVAESNAIEGSTLSVGETEYAVLKGVTITGHDPAYIRDAVALDRALQRAIEIARDKDNVLDIATLLEIHSLLLGDRQGSGILRSQRVKISGSDHTPPKTYEAVLEGMEKWEQWSKDNKDAPGPVRTAILHAWLTHIHPFTDGNGRSARAIGNMELIRSGYPSIIFRKRDRDRYLEALSESDAGGDISLFFDLVLDKVEDALKGLELAAQKAQGYSPIIAKLQRQQAQQVDIWNTAVNLLSSMLELELTRVLQELNGQVKIKQYQGISDVEDLLELCAGRNISMSWAFKLSISIPSLPAYDLLCFVGHRSYRMHQQMGNEQGPSLYWSRPNPDGYPKWKRSDELSPFAQEMTSRLGRGDEWTVLTVDSLIRQMTTSEIVQNVSSAILESLSSGLIPEQNDIGRTSS